MPEPEQPETGGSGKSLVQRIPQGVSKFVRDRATAAIKHLVGAYVPSVLAASQSAKDERDARSTIVAAVAKAAGDRAAADPEIVERMLDRLAGEGIGKQTNREAVAEKTIEYLGDEQGSAADTSRDRPLDDDWLNLYGSYAEKASSESLRDMWGRVLAGEIRKPGAFSLITLHFVSILDARAASVITKAVPWVISGELIPLDATEHGMTVADLVFLEEIGFGSGAGGTLLSTLSPQAHGNHVLRSGKTGFIVDNEKKPFDIRAFTLSLAGTQLCSVISVDAEVTGIVDAIKKAAPNAKAISVGSVEETPPNGYRVTNAVRVHPPKEEPI